MKFSITPSGASTPRRSWSALVLNLLLGAQLAAAIELDIHSKESIKRAAKIAADGMLAYYTGNQPGQIPGILPSPEYYWWEGGAMWMSLIDYWWYTGDDSYNHLITQGIQWQRGPDNNFMNLNWSAQTGNDDESFWAFAALDAAELKFPNPPKSGTPWLTLAQAVFNIQTTRFTNLCGGGLPWQVFTWSNGYTYKNTISNGCFFTLAARLARYTNNDTYADWGMKAWDWVMHAGLVSDTWQFWDGAFTTDNCTTVNGIQFSYNAGVFLYGAATMWNHTQKPIWRERVNGIISGLPVFFQHKILYEQWCEPKNHCNQDQRSFKAYLTRWMAVTIQLCPWTREKLLPLLRASAKAAAAQCTGGDSGTECGLRWVTNGSYPRFDGSVGAGEQMSAMSVFGSLMVGFDDDEKISAGPVTHKQGISHGNPAAGLKGSITDPTHVAPDIIESTSMADIIGAWIVTAILAILTLGMAAWALWPEKDAHLKFSGGGKYELRNKTVNQSAIGEKDTRSRKIGKGPKVDVSKMPSVVDSPRSGSIIHSHTDGTIVRSPKILSVATSRGPGSPVGWGKAPSMS